MQINKYLYASLCEQKIIAGDSSFRVKVYKHSSKNGRSSEQEVMESYIKGKGVRDLYLIKIARIGNKAEIHPEGGDKDPGLVFELEFLESLPQYVHIDLNIFRTYRDTLLGRIMGDMI